MKLQKCEREKKSFSEDQDEIKYLLYFGGGTKKIKKQKSQSKYSKTVFLLIY